MSREHEEQSLVMQWVETHSVRYPELSCLFAVPNVAVKFKGDAGKGFAMAQRMKSLGMKNGVPDLCLPIARGGFNALFIEMKRLVPRQTKTKGTQLDKAPTSDSQHLWHAKLRDHGSYVAVCYTAEEAEGVLEDYLNGKLKREAA